MYTPVLSCQENCYATNRAELMNSFQGEVLVMVRQHPSTEVLESPLKSQTLYSNTVFYKSLVKTLW